MAASTESKNIGSRILPALGIASYGAFSVNIMDPELFKSVFSPVQVQVANSLWFNAHLGVGIYLYNRKHLMKPPTYNRVMYSVFGSFIFNFGSVLFWATLKSLLPEIRAGRVFVGVSSACAFLAIGREYMNFLDEEEQVD